MLILKRMDLTTTAFQQQPFNNSLSTTAFQQQQIVQQRIVTFAIDPVAGREGRQSAIILPSAYMLLQCLLINWQILL
jgi:hypothetical protein